MIRHFSDFCNALQQAGFSGPIGGDKNNVFCLLAMDFGGQTPDGLRWFTGDPETDPWQWRARVLEERNDIAYGKVFFRKAGYITQNWYPYFLAARRGEMDFAQAYDQGTISCAAHQIHTVLRQNGALPVHTLKRMSGFDKAHASRFENALVELQMRLFITVCGEQQKISQEGLPYGWASTQFCTVEDFWPEAVFEKASRLSTKQAQDAIAAQIRALNPQADDQLAQKFIMG